LFGAQPEAAPSGSPDAGAPFLLEVETLKACIAIHQMPNKPGARVLFNPHGDCLAYTD
jgi:hypothetical protein